MSDRDVALRKALFVLAASLAALTIGCASGDAVTAEVSGVVSMEGKELPGAQVRFEPLPGIPGQARTVEADAQGCFVIPAERGLSPGEYCVRIVAYRPTGKTMPNPFKPELPRVEIMEEATPKRYGGLSSPLRAFVTLKEEENQFQFDLEAR